MTHPSPTSDSDPHKTFRFGAIAKIGAVVAIVLVALVIVFANFVDREGVVGDLILPVLGIGTLLSSVAGFLAGGVALLRERDRSVSTILATLAGALLGLLMISELLQR